MIILRSFKNRAPDAESSRARSLGFSAELSNVWKYLSKQMYAYLFSSLVPANCLKQ